MSITQPSNGTGDGSFEHKLILYLHQQFRKPQFREPKLWFQCISTHCGYPMAQWLFETVKVIVTIGPDIKIIYMYIL